MIQYFQSGQKIRFSAEPYLQRLELFELYFANNLGE